MEPLGRVGTLTDYRGWNLQVRRLYTLMGLDPNRHLPTEGTEGTMVNGVQVWVDSKERAKEKGVFHRVRCLCPKCYDEVPASRLFQHKCNLPFRSYRVGETATASLTSRREYNVAS